MDRDGLPVCTSKALTLREGVYRTTGVCLARDITAADLTEEVLRDGQTAVTSKAARTSVGDGRRPDHWRRE